MTKCVYPGSFDPFTLGHLDILERACALFGEVKVAVLHNSRKRCFFTLDERLAFIRSAIEARNLSNASAEAFEGLLADYIKIERADCVLRGIRGAIDYEYEAAMAALNKRLYPKCETVVLMASPEHIAVSSSMVREIGRLGGDIGSLVPEANRETIAERLLQDE